MRPILIDILHFFILAMMGGFLVLLVTASLDNSSVWARRYTRNRRGQRVLPDQFR